jgi:hypothetical protein
MHDPLEEIDTPIGANQATTSATKRSYWARHRQQLQHRHRHQRQPLQVIERADNRFDLRRCDYWPSTLRVARSAIIRQNNTQMSAGGPRIVRRLDTTRETGDHRLRRQARRAGCMAPRRLRAH